MWTPTTRQQHTRFVSRYQTDLTDAEWRVIEPHLPKRCAMGRPREWPMREIVNGIFYVMRAGCAAKFSLAKRSEILPRNNSAPLRPAPASPHLPVRQHRTSRPCRPLPFANSVTARPS
jgi:hypothetical protein